MNCIGCGGPLVGAFCGMCGTRARGAQFRERVTLRLGLPLPPVCCCCLKGADTVLALERSTYYGTHLSSLPACRECARTRSRSRSVFQATWLVTMFVGAIVAIKLLPGTAGMIAGLAMIPGSYWLAFPLLRALWSPGPGHVHGCAAARLVRGGGPNEVRIELGNRAYARILARRATPVAVDRGTQA